MNKDLKVGRQKKRPAFSFEGTSGHLPPRPQKRHEFLRIASTGDRLVTPGLILQRGPLQETPRNTINEEIGNDDSANDNGGANRPPTIGYTASRKVGNAIARNFAKRRMREIARLLLQEQLPTDRAYVLVGRRAATKRSLQRMAQDIQKALEKSGWCQK